uniref:Uncharacterized protein n=1 Tax=Cacopsylla melanoneura TaxID=428564 RepID=A0A8D8R0D7_9HEMI
MITRVVMWSSPRMPFLILRLRSVDTFYGCKRPMFSRIQKGMKGLRGDGRKHVSQIGMYKRGETEVQFHIGVFLNIQDLRSAVLGIHLLEMDFEFLLPDTKDKLFSALVLWRPKILELAERAVKMSQVSEQGIKQHYQQLVVGNNGR